MKNKMFFITTFLFIGFIIALLIFLEIKNNLFEIITISIGITLYHFIMRLIVGYSTNAIMKNNANYKNNWFKEKSFEKKFYNLIQIRKWKKYLPTYNPLFFDISQKSIKEIIGASCQAEIVHEIIMLLSLLPIILIPFLGGAVAIIITSIVSMLFDFLFVLLQRYNRPKLIRVMERFKRI